jgi:hypothetical protein
MLIGSYAEYFTFLLQLLLHQFYLKIQKNILNVYGVCLVVFY